MIASLTYLYYLTCQGHLLYDFLCIHRLLYMFPIDSVVFCLTGLSDIQSPQVFL